MKIDGGVPLTLADVPAAARALERRGYDGAWCGEISHDPFLPLVLAAEHTTDLELGTCIAVAFARNPMTVANLGWDLQAYSRGRFLLGLGSQIKPHIERRFSMPWSSPVARMREFVLAVRAIWSSWSDGTPLRFTGEFYRHTLMTPMFTPEPHPYGVPKVFVAAVGDAMTALAGEIADGVHTHAFTTERYVREVTLPALEQGLERAGRDRSEVGVCCPAFVVTGEDDEAMARSAAAMRRQISFYGSTPAYRGVLELHGWGSLHEELHTLSLKGHWDAMGELVDDEVLHTFAVVAPLDRVVDEVRRRYQGLVDRLMFTLPATLPDEAARSLFADLRS